MMDECRSDVVVGHGVNAPLNGRAGNSAIGEGVGACQCMSKPPRLTTLKNLLVTLTLGVTLTACAQPGRSDTTTWKEEVLQHDGTKLVIERTVKRGGRHEVGQHPPIKEQSLAFALPGSQQKVTWDDPFTADIGGANFLPMLLEAQKDVAYLVVYPMGCLSYNKWGRPNPPYVVFKYQDRQWGRIALQELPLEVKTPNLIFSEPDDEARNSGQSIVSAETIKNHYEGYRQPEYKTILREPVSEAGTGITSCEELVRYKCGWGAPGDFNRKYFENACK